MSDAQIIGGHKATIHNPNTSAEAKEHSKEVLKDEFNGVFQGTPSAGDCNVFQLTWSWLVVVDGNKTKDLDHVVAGLKG